MKSTGVVRKLDRLGRIVIPMEVRRTNGWGVGTPLAMFCDEQGSLLLKPYGVDGEKEELIGQLTDLIDNSANSKVVEIATKAIRFIRNEVKK